MKDVFFFENDQKLYIVVNRNRYTSYQNSFRSSPLLLLLLLLLLPNCNQCIIQTQKGLHHLPTAGYISTNSKEICVTIGCCMRTCMHAWTYICVTTSSSMQACLHELAQQLQSHSPFRELFLRPSWLHGCLAGSIEMDRCCLRRPRLTKKYINRSRSCKKTTRSRLDIIV